MSTWRLSTPVLVIGCGIAGATAALTLADAGVEVTVLTAETDPGWCNTVLAQGGIVARGPQDNPKLLERDIQVAGWRHNYGKAVRHLALHGPDAVQDILIDRVGVAFAQHDGQPDYIREGGHSAGRILHCADHSGLSIMKALMAALQAAPNVRLLAGRTAVDLLTTHHHAGHLDYKYSLDNQCVGAYVFNQETGQVETMLADLTVLATGGLGQVYLHSTNTSGSIGSGMAMAYRAGARVMNAEFIQFHPTSLYHRAERRFLISEAVRGAGARLVDSKGKPFMDRYDPRADLAPRDIVTRAIMDELLKTGEPCVFLNAADYVNEDLAERFPTIFNRCMEMGVDMRKDSIPVVPAAHYSCGGIQADLSGRTTLSRLYAVGECSCTGIHGANRLASTSLLEGLLWGRNAAQDMRKVLNHRSILSRKLLGCIPDWQSPGDNQREDPALIAQDWSRIRTTMWNYVGISRNSARLRRAFDDLNILRKHLHTFYRQTAISRPLIGLFHGCQAASTICWAALRNHESIGCHHRVD